MIYLSPFTPLCFSPFKGDRAECRQPQIFSSADKIVVELFSDESVSANVTDGNVSIPVTFTSYDIESGGRVFIAEVDGLTDGTYIMSIEGYGNSQPFVIESEQSELNSTTLIQYTNEDNRRRKDAMFLVGGNRIVFSLRVPGGFRSSGISFSVDNEQFTTSDGDIVELYSIDTVQSKFTLGNANGCTIWHGEMLNRILCCDYVFFDGLRYSRKGNAVPEISQVHDSVEAFVFTQNLQRVNKICPTIQSLIP